MTEYGNMWTSDYAWGWAPFHYGRWTHDSYYGWVWIPDNEWGPAWVSWRSSSDYYGWAPMGPGISVSMSFDNYRPSDDWWIFIAPTYMYQPRWHDYYRGNGSNTVIIQRTTIINNTYVNNSRTYVAGPRAEDVRRITHKDVTVYKVGNESIPGKAAIQNNVVNIYRPSVEKSGKETAPPKVKRAEHPIGNQQSKDAGVKTSPGQKQNGLPPNKDVGNQNNPERKTEMKKQQPQRVPQRQQPAYKQPGRQKENVPAQATPPMERRENQAPKENIPSPNHEQKRFPPEQEHGRPSKERPAQPVTPMPERKEMPRQRQENNPVPKQQQERQPSQQQHQPERNNPPQQNNHAQGQQQERPAPQQQQQQPDRNRPQQEAIPPKPADQRTPEMNQEKKRQEAQPKQEKNYLDK